MSHRQRSWHRQRRPTWDIATPTFAKATADCDNSLPNLAPGQVKAQSLWDLSGSWKATEQLQLRLGVQNLLNTQPPFSNQSDYFLSTCDPTCTDPPGRACYASLKYSFK